MTKDVLQEVFFARPHNVYDVALYCYLLSFGGGRHRLCTRDMSLLLGMSKRSLLDARRRLELEGLIVVEKGCGQKGGVYEVVGLDAVVGEGGMVSACEDFESFNEDCESGHGMTLEPNGESDREGKNGGGTSRSTDEAGNSTDEAGDSTDEAERERMERDAAEAVAHRGELRVDDSLPERLMAEEKEWSELCCKKMAMKTDDMLERMRIFVDMLICDGVRWKRRRDMKRHFNRWLRQENDENLKYKRNEREKGKTESSGKWRSKQEQREQQIRDRRAADYAMLMQASGRPCVGIGGREGAEAGVWGHR